MEFENILYSESEGIVTIQINRPKALNALNTRTNLELEAALDLLEKDGNSRVLIVRGSDTVFVAGADVGELMDAGPKEAKDNCELAHRVFLRIENLRIPVIAAINGPALGGGLELALSCDFRIGGEKAQFGLPEVNLGIIPGAGGTQRLAKLIGVSRAKEMIYFGDKIKSDRALELGLINKRVPDQEVYDAAVEMAKALCKRPAVALSLAKKSIQYGANYHLEDGLCSEKEFFSSAFSSADQKEGMKAFFERRPAVFVNQ